MNWLRVRPHWYFSGGLRAAVFLITALLCAGLRAAPTQQQLAALAEDPIWQALIHHHHGRYTLPDTGLLLDPAGTPRSELVASLERLTTDPQFRCRYPARDGFLRSRLGLPPAPAQECADLDEFTRRVPATRISLVFVAENIEQPASIMGHLILKLAGEDTDGQSREHAISFFTDPIGLNFPLMLYQGLVAGMPGYYSLSPYREHVQAYVSGEQRALWEYELDLDGQQRERLFLHLLELKYGTYRYLFTSYNCATLVLELLAVARPEVLTRHHRWVTPKEVVRIAQRHGLIMDAAAVFPAATAAAVYAPLLTPDTLANVRATVSAGDDFSVGSAVPAAQQVIANNLALAHNELLVRHRLRSPEEARRWRDAFMAQDPALEIGFDASSRYNPALSGDDLRITLGWQAKRGAPDRLRLRWMPVSHYLEDDTRNFLDESELKLFEGVASVSADGKVRVEELTLFSALSLRPWDTVTTPLSSHFEIAWREVADRDLRASRSLDVTIGRGLTARAHHDVDAYAMLLVAGQFGRRGQLAAQPEVGLVMRLAFDMKASLIWRGEGLSDRSQRLRLGWSWFMSPRTVLKLGWLEERGRTHQRRRSSSADVMLVF